MIKDIEIIDNSNTPLRYLSKLPIFCNGKKFEFKPGINIIIGPNGSGKSTLLKLIYEFTWCSRSISSTISEDALLNSRLWPIGNLDKEVLLDGVSIRHDYRTTIFRSIHGNEYDNESAVANITNFHNFVSSKGKSMGEQINSCTANLFKVMFSEKTNLEFPIKDIKNLIPSINSTWQNRLNMLLEYYEANKIEFDKLNPTFTVIMDEPDRNLDIDGITELYDILSLKKPQTQLIAVVHNPMLIYKLSKLKYINFIEFRDGYLDSVINFVK